jgi:glycosyltransferase involved in cell wall biosynthesis
VSIIHARSRAPAWSAEGAAKRTGAHFVTTFHGTYGAGNRLKRVYNRVMTRGARVIAISEFIAQHLDELYGVDAERIRTIPRGIDVGLHNPERVSQERIIQLAQRWQIPDDGRIILLPGRFARWKGHMLMIEALAHLGRPDVRCVLIGADTASPSYKRALEAEARARGVESQLQMVDFCRDMPAAYMLSDVVVSASLEPEAFGRTLAEALAMGRPAVGPRHGGAVEILENGRIGWLYHPGDARELAAALNSAIELGPEDRDRVAHAAMAAVRENFTKEMMCARTLAVYDEVLADAG